MEFDGICVVHAYYEGVNDFDQSESLEHSKNSDSDDEVLDKMTNLTVKQNFDYEFIHDFMNFAPDRHRIVRGVGFIRHRNGVNYVITCNHIMVKYAKYKGYCLNDKVIVLDLSVFHRIPELDLVILTVTNYQTEATDEVTLVELETNAVVEKIYQSNKLITAEYKPKSINHDDTNVDIKFSTIPINSDIEMVFDILVSKMIRHMPLLNINVEQLSLPSLVKTDTFKQISLKVSGLSGSIIRSDDKNIGMVCLYVDTNKGHMIKAIPMFLIDMMFENVMCGITKLTGIQIDTQPCVINLDENRISGHYVTKDSCYYYNGIKEKKKFNFVKGDVILEVENNQFNNNLIWSDTICMHVPLNTFMMLKSIDNPYEPISIKVLRQQPDIKIRNYNLMCTYYDNMFNLRIYEHIIKWNNWIFMELTEHFVEFYKTMGIDLNISSSNSINNEKRVILLNYNKIPSKLSCLNDYKQILSKSDDKYFVDTVHMIGQKRILNLKELKLILESGKKQKLTLKHDTSAKVTSSIKTIDIYDPNSNSSLNKNQEPSTTATSSITSITPSIAIF